MTVNTNEVSEDRRCYMIFDAIYVYITLIYLAIYCDHFRDKGKATSLLKQAMNSKRISLKKTLVIVMKNDVEMTVFNRLEQLLTILLSRLDSRRNDPIPRIFINTSDITMLLLRTGNEAASQRVVKCAKLVLSLCKQFTYEDVNIVIPNISITFDGENEISYNSYTRETQFGIKSAGDDSVLKTYDLLASLFKGIVFGTSQSRESQIIDLCRLVHIPTMPDARTGFNITQFSIIDTLANLKLPGVHRRMKSVSDVYISDVRLIGDASFQLIRDLVNLDEVKKVNTVKIGMEATDDTIEEEDTEGDAPSEGGEDPEGGEKSEGDAPSEGGEDPSLDTDSSSEGDEEGDPPADETATGDPTDPDQVDDQNNTSPTKKTSIFGVNFELAGTETFEDTLYKIGVCSLINDIVEFNRTELPSDTLMLLQKWKSMFLFIVSVEETKKLLKALKVKF